VRASFFRTAHPSPSNPNGLPEISQGLRSLRRYPWFTHHQTDSILKGCQNLTSQHPVYRGLVLQGFCRCLVFARSFDAASFLSRSKFLVQFTLPSFWLAQLDKVSTIPICMSAELSHAAGRENLFMAERWLSLEEISAHLGVSPITIYKWFSPEWPPSSSSLPCRAGKL
jgi:hypothetical protein